MSLMDDVNQLKAELETLKQLQTNNQTLLADHLAALGEKLDLLSSQVNASADDDQASLELITQPDIAQLAIDTLSPEDVTVTQVHLDIHGNITHQLPASKGSLSALLEQLTNGLLELSSQALSPFSEVSSKARQFYQDYQAKGLGPVFLMTLAGIITLTLGFGYLLQFSINHWLSDLGKALLGLATSNAIILGGIFIHMKRPGMREYSSAIVGLGLILNYLCLYYLGPYFQLVPNSISLGLLLANTLLGYGLSNKLETKVVAIVAMLGGSLAPLLLFDGATAATLYLPYLMLLGCCSLYQSYKLTWPTLIEITAILHIACIQYASVYIGISSDVNTLYAINLFALHGMFYLYSVVSLLLLIKTSLSARLLVIPISLLVFFVYIIGDLYHFAGEIFLVNALVCSLLYWWIKQDKQIGELTLAFAASFAAFAALYMLSPHLLGLVLLLEGLLLIWIGCKQQLIAIRFESYVLLILGLLNSIVTLLDALTSSLSSAWQTSLSISVMMIISCGIIFAATRLLLQHKVHLIPLEKTITIVGQEFLNLLYSITFLIIIYFISPEYCLNAIPIITGLLLVLSARHSLRFTEILAWLWLIPLIGLVAYGIVEANSFSLSAQMLNAKLARIELFVCLLAGYYLYQKYYPQAKLIKLAYYTQLVCFFVLPLLFLPKVIRNYADYVPIALWLSTVISISLAYYVNHKVLRVQANALAFIATFATAIFCIEQQWQGLVALLIGTVLMGLIAKRYLSLNDKWQSTIKPTWHLSPYFAALVIVVIVQTGIGFIDNSWAITLAILSGYFMLVTERTNPIGRFFLAPIKVSYRIGFYAIFGFAALPILFHFDMPLAVNISNGLQVAAEIIVLLSLGYYLTKRRSGIKINCSSIAKIGFKWGWHTLLVVSYLIWAKALAGDLAATVSAILMVIHGSVLMFLSLRPHHQDLLKLSGILFGITTLKVIVVDMASFILVQKVIAFMLIGIILLTVAYFYQRRKNQISPQSEPEGIN
jgi:hypothetical protein